MKNINYSIKKQFKISDEGICLLPMLLRALCRLTKKQRYYWKKSIPITPRPQKGKSSHNLTGR